MDTKVNVLGILVNVLWEMLCAPSFSSLVGPFYMNMLHTAHELVHPSQARLLRLTPVLQFPGYGASHPLQPENLFSENTGD